MRRFIACGLLVASLSSAVLAQKNLAGTAEIMKSLDRLNNLGSVLMIAAHPDDENTAFIAYFARGRNMRTGYLSLTRGEGGQNLIGSEQGDKIGIIRTQELLAARHIDGGEQFFSRFIDFGFSKSATETINKWGREQVIGDIVWTIRKFRPDVIVLRFSGTPRDGHGQHQTSAMLAKEAFAAAADAAKYPEQLKLVEPWQARRLYFNLFAFRPQDEAENEKVAGTLKLDLGGFDPLLGYSYTEIAGQSRSQHRSQGMGSPERKGSSRNHLILLAGDAAPNDVFDGIDTSWQRVGLPKVGEVLARARKEFRPENPSSVIPLLGEARALIASRNDPISRRKLRDIDETIALCAGLWVDASVERAEVIPGSTVKVSLNAIVRSNVPVSVTSHAMKLEPNQMATAVLDWTIPKTQPLSQPFWMVEPKEGTRYRIPDPSLLGKAENDPVETVKFAATVGGTPIELYRGYHNRYVDSADGELVRPVVVVPAVAVALSERAMLFPSPAPRTVEVTVTGKVAKASGTVRLEAPSGWQISPSSAPFELADANEQRTVSFGITPGGNAGKGTLRAIATMGGDTFRHGIDVVRYPHIPPQTLFPPAEAELIPADVKILSKKIGYVMGAGDDVPDSLKLLGCTVTLLAAEDLSRGDLAQFDAIVTGVRAYNTRPELRANHQRLMDYVAQGGTLITQYNVADNRFWAGRQTVGTKFGPAEITLGNGRVTDEEAVIEPLAASKLLESPNRITSDDWKGWVQERGLYYPAKWDATYQPLFRMKDPGEEPQDGATLVARHGKGVYIYTALAWFRQLPAGVPGAYRVFANFLSAAKAQ